MRIVSYRIFVSAIDVSLLSVVCIAELTLIVTTCCVMKFLISVAVETSKHILKLFSPLSSYTILVFIARQHTNARY